MNRDSATLILSNLTERTGHTASSVVLTSTEIKALQVFFGESVNQPKSDVDQNNVVDAESVIPLRLPEGQFFWTPDEPPSSDLILCLDFGTSFSKAYANKTEHIDDIPDLIDIVFDEEADVPARFLVPSELFIYLDFIYFGAATRRQFETVEATQNQLIDSPKQYMTLGTQVAELHQKPLHPEQDPSQLLSQRDALVLYLAHLNCMAEKSLKNQGFSTNVLRRYAHPAWDDDTTDANSAAMKRIMAESIAMAKLFSNELKENMLLSDAIFIAQEARKAGDTSLPFDLLSDPVHEATAAGAGALMATKERHRQPYIILDIGAGTTDVSGCICVNNPDKEYVRVFEVTGARRAIRRAGNNIDSILLKEIMERSTAAFGTIEYNRIFQSLRKKIRGYKEILFSEGSVLADLESDETFEIDLMDFLECQSIDELFGRIREIVTNAAFQVIGDDESVVLVATGGGANLPIVKDLVKKQIEKNGRKIGLRLRDAMPDDLKEIYPNLVNFYPQLAVAIGGSHPLLPDQMNSITEGITDPGPITLAPIYRS